MSEWMGRITICDRCGRECRRRYLDTQELDGGFTRINKYEPLETGWEIHTDIGALCPACEKEYQTMVSAFMKGVEGEATTPCATCDDYAGDGTTCRSGYLVYDFSISTDNCEAPKLCSTCAHEYDDINCADCYDYSLWSPRTNINHGSLVQ